MARISGIQTVNNPRTGVVQKAGYRCKKALNNKQMSPIIEDLLDHMAILKSKDRGNFIPWSEAKARIDKKFDLK